MYLFYALENFQTFECQGNLSENADLHGSPTHKIVVKLRFLGRSGAMMTTGKLCCLSPNENPKFQTQFALRTEWYAGSLISEHVRPHGFSPL